MKKIAKITALFIAILLLAMGAVAQGTGSEAAIVLTGGSNYAGETVEVTVALENNPGIVSAQLYIAFDESFMTLEEVKDAGLLEGANHRPNLNAPYPLSWVNDSATSNFTVNGTIATLVFRLDDQAEGSTDVTVSYSQDMGIYNKDLKDVSFETKGCTVSVGEPAAPAPTDLSEFEYSLSGTEMTITAFVGSSTKVIVAPTYAVAGQEYQVVAIGEEAFYECETVQSVTLPDGLKEIGISAFDTCPGLTEIVIPASVELVDEYAFYGCESLVRVTVLGAETELAELSLGYYPVSRKEDGIVEGFTIYGHRTSTAATYATENETGFEDLLSFRGASLVLESDLSITYLVDAAVIDRAGFTNVYVQFEMNEQSVKVDATKKRADLYLFTFDGIAPQKMNDTVTATIYATFAGNGLTSEAKEYSVAQYCYNTLAETADAELRTLLVDLLHYGAAVQTYENYNTDALADQRLTAEQLSWGTAADPVPENGLNLAFATVAQPKAAWTSASLYLKDRVALRFKFAAPSVQGLTVKVENGTKTWTVTEDEFVVLGNNTYCFYLDELGADQMGDVLKLTFTENGAAVSNTLCYSIESYVFEKQNSTVPNLAALVKSLLKYGDAANAYAN